jgi:hypothetical protein
VALLAAPGRADKPAVGELVDALADSADDRALLPGYDVV